MALTVRDLMDLLALLEQHPEWKSALRASLLGEEVLRLPELVREISAEARALVEAQKRTEARVEELVQAQGRTEGRLVRLERRVGDLVGSDLERRCRERAHAFFQRVLKGIHLVPPVDLQQLLDGAVRAGRVTEEEQHDLLPAHVVAQGRRGGQETYLLVEVSGELKVYDVERAARKAEILRRAVGVPILAAVAGERLDPDAEAEARARGVWRVLDGATFPP